MSSPETLLAGRYRLRDRLGGGGMGEVWRATDQVLGRTVAVKLMRPELVAEPGFADRFRAEARALAAIRHGGVVTVHDYHGDDAGAFLVMEYIEGESLASLLRRQGRLDAAATMAMVAAAAEALQATHDRGVVHRDIKPANLLVSADGSLVLTDFGIARTAEATSLTMPGAIIGTPAYISPEQVLGHPATAASDLFSLGVVGYECLMGQRPFEGVNSFAVAHRRVQEDAPPVSGDIPAGVAAVIDRALAREPGQRWRSAGEMAAAARRAIDLAGASPTTLHRYLPGRAAPPRTVTQPAALSGPHPAPGPPPPSAPRRPTPSAGPRRPAVVTMASALFVLAAVTLLLYVVATLSVLEGVVGVVEDYSNDRWADAAGLGAIVALGGLGLVGLSYLVVAWQAYRGRRGARGWAFTLAIPLLCCVLPASYSAELGERINEERTQAVADRLAAGLPEWYEPLTGSLVAGGAVALVLALVLVVLPPAGRFFRRRPAVGH